MSKKKEQTALDDLVAEALAEKTERVRPYELLYIIPANITENETKPVMEAVRNVLTEFKSDITDEEMIGKQKLAYPIKKETHGYYVFVRMNLSTTVLSEINTKLSHMTDVLRHLFTQVEEGAYNPRHTSTRNPKAEEETETVIEETDESSEKTE